MLNLSLAAISHGEERAQWAIPTDHPMWQEGGSRFLEPVAVDVEARPIGDGGVLVRGRIRTVVQLACRRCDTAVTREIDAPIDLLFEPLTEDEEAELAGEVYPLPPKGADLDLIEPLRAELLLLVPEFVVCHEACRGLCPKCGANLNEAVCGCTVDRDAGPWDALKRIKFD